MQDLEWGEVTESLSVTLSSLDTLQSTAAIAHLRLWLISTFYAPHGDFKINAIFIGIQQQQLPATAQPYKDKGRQFFIRALLEGISL